MVATQVYYKQGFQKSVLDTHSWRKVDNSVSFIIPYLNKAQSVLDIGCGPGLILIDLANYVKSVTGIDPSEGVIEIANRTLSSFAQLYQDRVSFSIGSAYEIPFHDNLFEVVFAHQVVIHLADPVKGIEEMIRVCKPGGYVLVKDADLDMFTIFPKKYQTGINYYLKRSNTSSQRQAGRLLKVNFLDAGAREEDITFTSSVWNVNSPYERHRWADDVIERIKTGREIDYTADKASLDKTINTYTAWANDPEANMFMPHGEVAYKKV